MSTHTPGSNDDQKRLDIARRLYKALVAQDPDRLIMLCDGNGRCWPATNGGLTRMLPRKPHSGQRRHR